MSSGNECAGQRELEVMGQSENQNFEQNAVELIEAFPDLVLVSGGLRRKRRRRLLELPGCLQTPPFDGGRVAGMGVQGKLLSCEQDREPVGGLDSREPDSHHWCWCSLEQRKRDVVKGAWWARVI